MAHIAAIHLVRIGFQLGKWALSDEVVDRRKKLLKAARAGDTGKALRQIQKGVPVDCPLDDDGWTALHYAALNGHVGTVQALLRAEASHSASDKDGFTAVHMAAQKGHVAVVSALLAAGADPLVRTNKGSKLTPLHLAAVVGQTDACLALVRQGRVPIDVPDGTTGGTPLHHAALHGHVATVAALVQAGASLRATNFQGYTTLHWVACEREEKHAAMATQLVRLGAPKFARDNDGRTPLDIASPAVKRALLAA